MRHICDLMKKLSSRVRAPLLEVKRQQALLQEQLKVAQAVHLHSPFGNAWLLLKDRRAASPRTPRHSRCKLTTNHLLITISTKTFRRRDPSLRLASLCQLAPSSSRPTLTRYSNTSSKNSNRNKVRLIRAAQPTISLNLRIRQHPSQLSPPPRKDAAAKWWCRSRIKPYSSRKTLICWLARCRATPRPNSKK